MPSPTLAPTAAPEWPPYPTLPDVLWPAPTAHPYPPAEEPRQGVAAAFGEGDLSAFGQWSYSWTAYVPPVPGPAEHVPMLVGWLRNGLPRAEIIREMDARAEHNYWLVFNECEHQHQCNASPQEAAAFYHDVVVETIYVQGADPDAQLIVGGVNAHECGINWLRDFVAAYESRYGPLPRAGWHFHLYPDIRPSGWPGNCDTDWVFDDHMMPSPAAAFELWRQHATNALAFVQSVGAAEDEVWFTEMGCINAGGHQQPGPVCNDDGFMADYAGRVLAWLNDEGRWVDRYAWYTNWDQGYWHFTRLLESAGPEWKFSSLGWFYAQVRPAAAVPRP
ncbi:MAG: glycosyl hydrolase [Candidatus Promineifilaceae bacterium]